MKTASIGLSINFIVILIISITVFGLGMRFIFDIMSSADDIKKMSIENIDRRISELMCGSTEKICIDKNNLKLFAGGREQVVTLRILNIEPGDNFQIKVEKGLYVQPDRTVVQPSDPDYVNKVVVVPETRFEVIRENYDKTFGIAFQAPEGVRRGTYVFDVIVKKEFATDRYDFTKVRITVE